MKKITLLACVLIFSISKNISAQSLANYDISVRTIWNSTDHSSVPSSAHWSNLVGATHKNPNDVLQFGAIAPFTDGIKDVAEFGSNSKFQNEINTLISNNNADQYLQTGFSPNNGDNDLASLNNITVSEDFPYITLVSMVAPSPDWFIAINSENLRSNNNINNGWKESYTLDLYAYDAGTDSGTNYNTSSDIPTSPREPISIVSGFPINGNKMATITFTYKTSSTLSTAPLDNLDRIRISNNPTTKKIIISNIENSNLQTVLLYNVLGNLVKEVVVSGNASKLEIKTSVLNSGLYIIKLTEKTGVNKTTKLIIN